MRLKIVLFWQRQHVPIFISSTKDLLKIITSNNWVSQGIWSTRHQILTILVENNTQKTGRILHFSIHCWNISPKHRWHAIRKNGFTWTMTYSVEYNSTDTKMYQKTILILWNIDFEEREKYFDKRQNFLLLHSYMKRFFLSLQISLFWKAALGRAMFKTFKQSNLKQNSLILLELSISSDLKILGLRFSSTWNLTTLELCFKSENNFLRFWKPPQNRASVYYSTVCKPQILQREFQHMSLQEYPVSCISSCETWES